MTGKDFVTASAKRVLAGLADIDVSSHWLDEAASTLIGPTFYWALSGRDVNLLAADRLAAGFVEQLSVLQHGAGQQAVSKESIAQ